MTSTKKLIGVLSFTVLLLPVCAPPPEPEVDLKAEEQAIRKLMDEILVAYGNRDAKAMTGLCDETMMNFGNIHRGPEAIERLWTNFLGGLEDTKLNFLEEICLEFVTPEVAIYQARFEFTNRPPDEDGNPRPDYEFFAANVYVKRDGRWLRKGAFIRPVD